VIPFYVMTRDIRKDLAPEQFTVTVKGFDASAKFSAYDPLLNQRVDVRSKAAGGGAVQLELTARDYPVLLETE
jgi:hypothetical protein